MSQVDLDVVKNEARRRIHNLVEDYMRVVAAGKKESFNEERVKIAFIVPVLEALGWNPRTDEVLPEQATLTGRADFGLRVGGRTKIFVEMKRFAKSLDGHDTVKGRPRSYAEQAIQYAWGMKADWAVLSNFEEIRLYDSHVKKPEDGLVWKKPIRFTEYESRFDELWLISRQSVVSGALDAYRAKIERPPVDKAFLDDLMNCRQILAEDIKNNNPGLTYDQINESVQKILDRLIFIKNCEDRLIIPAESLWKRYKAWQETAIDKNIVIFMMDLKNVFRYFDQVYNGKLFEKHSCEDLKISNEVLEEIIDTLYGDGEHLGYNFSVIPVDVLGQAYELYIGSIIKEKEGYAKAVEIVKQPAKRKAYGIYYTPEAVVDYIVRSTLGSILGECKTPEDVSRIKVLDPACGSGSFLIKAFDVIKEWYENYNKLNRPISVPGTLDAHIVPVSNIEERILTENLYGVDLDPQAVEITILNLSLKAVKTKEKLPYIADHIKCGNSLIDDDRIAGSKAFKWEQEFPDIIKEGGFDAVIGNPPYGAEFSNVEKDFLKSKYREDKTGNSASFFILRGLELVKKNGYFAYIVPKQLTYISSWQYIRENLLDTNLVRIVDVSEAFQDVELEQIVFVTKKEKASDTVIVGFLNNAKIEESKSNRKYFTKERLPLWVNDQNYGIFNKILSGSIRLAEIADVNWGGPVAKYLSKMKTADSISCVRGREIRRYSVSPEYFIKTKDMVQTYYVRGEKLLFQRIVSRYGSKIIANYRDARIVGTYCNDDFYADKTVTLIWNSKISLKYLLGLLNSKLISWFAHRYLWNRSQLTMEFMYSYARDFPIRASLEENQKNRMENLVDKMLSLKQRLNEIEDKKTDERAETEEEIKRTDAEIDDLVYEIYEITEAEKKIIESLG